MSGPARKTDQTVRIDIGVCTYRRPQLERTLRSLGALQLPPEATLRIIVADNDAEPSARRLVGAVAADLPFEVRYIHCPASNISLARNACLGAANGDFLAFVDDDEEVAPDWLAELFSMAGTSGADAVLGPVQALYEDGAPGWMREGDFHSTVPVWVKGDIRTGYTCNVMLRLASPSVEGRRFDLSLGRSGGEDTEFFTRLHDAGGRIAYAPNALAREPVPASRARFGWLAKRRFRSGQTHGRLLGGGRPAAALMPQLLLATAKAGYCAGATAISAALAQRRNRYALRGIMHAGVVLGLLGVREIRQYGDGASLEGQDHAA
jgi:succinoglycan biosynthesis protein ExoM